MTRFEGLEFRAAIGNVDSYLVTSKLTGADAEAAAHQVVVIGGGYIGMEIAAGLAINGLEPTVVFPGASMLSRLFTPELAQFYEAYFENKGVTFIKSDSAVSFEGTDGKVTIP